MHIDNQKSFYNFIIHLFENIAKKSMLYKNNKNFF
jgi:hypothetical protein